MTLTSEQLQQGFLIGEALVQPALNRIRTPQGETHVEPKVMAVLVCLARNAGQVVSRDALYDAVWGRTVVSDQALTNCISELRQRLGDDRAGPRYIETVPKRGYRLIAPVRAVAPAAGDVPGANRPARRPRLAAFALVAAVVLGFIAWASLTRLDASVSSVVVVPFRNAGGEESLDYLRFALPDEVTTLLTSSRGLIVRPFEHTPEQAPLDAGRERGAEHVVTGHYYLEGGNRLTVAVEAQEVAGERILWRARITVPADDLLALRGELAERVGNGLLPALGAAGSEGGPPQPADPEAYALYLRALALPRNPEAEPRAVELLVRAVSLDPGFAPAWTALGARWYAYGSFGDGGEFARHNALTAWEKALDLDPGAIAAFLGIIKLRTESGDLVEAYTRARRLVGRFERNTDAHLALGYVYKYGGMLEASQRHCDEAFALDPYNPDLRSCAYSFLYAGKLDRVQAFLDTDAGSFFSTWGTVLLLLRRGDDAAALTAARQGAPDRHTRFLMEACLEGRRGAALDDEAAAFVAYWSTRRDPEFAYGLAPMLEYCGRRDEALAFLEKAVDKGFCGWPGLDRDPIWANVREDPRFQRLREQGIACHRRFREAVEAIDEGAAGKKLAGRATR